MEHAGAIAQAILPLLLSLLCGMGAWGAFGHKRFMARNDREHERLAEEGRSMDRRLTRAETKIEHIQAELDRVGR